MQKLSSIAVAIGLVAIVFAGPAIAQNTRSFVSSTGKDGANCRRLTPCRTLAGAFLKTNAGGEIGVLDPGDFGPLTITKAISIINDGTGTAGLIPPVGGNGITINAGAGDAVSLRGLTIDGLGRFSTTGIRFNSGGSLTLRDCVVHRTRFDGLLFQPTGAARLTVSDSVFEAIGGVGVYLSPTGAGAVTAMLNRVELNNNFHGLFAPSSGKTSGKLAVSVSDSVAANNTGIGFYALGTSVPSRVTLMRSVAANNVWGVYANGAAAVVRIGESMVTDNTNGWGAAGGGQIESYGTNQIDGNTAADDFPNNIALD